MVEPEREREFPATRVVPVKTGVVPFFTRLGLKKTGVLLFFMRLVLEINETRNGKLGPVLGPFRL